MKGVGVRIAKFDFSEAEQLLRRVRELLTVTAFLVWNSIFPSYFRFLTPPPPFPLDPITFDYGSQQKDVSVLISSLFKKLLIFSSFEEMLLMLE